MSFHLVICFFFFKLKTAYDRRISDWSSDVCSSDLSLAMSEKHCRLVSFAPSVQKRASSKKDRYRLGKWLFAIVGRFGFAQERNSFFCRRRTTAPAAKHPGPPCRAARSQCANR